MLVNNAGATWGAPLEEFPDAGWDKVLDTNVKGPFRLTVALLPRLREAATAGGPDEGGEHRKRRRDSRAGDGELLL